MESGPSQADIEAAEMMTAEDRMAMIEGMVEGLAERLAEEPEDIDGWLRLTNAYIVLSRKDDAQAALSNVPSEHPSYAALEARLQALD